MTSKCPSRPMAAPRVWACAHVLRDLAGQEILLSRDTAGARHSGISRGGALYCRAKRYDIATKVAPKEPPRESRSRPHCGNHGCTCTHGPKSGPMIHTSRTTRKRSEGGSRGRSQAATFIFKPDDPRTIARQHSRCTMHSSIRPTILMRNEERSQ